MRIRSQWEQVQNFIYQLSIVQVENSKDEFDMGIGIGIDTKADTPHNVLHMIYRLFMNRSQYSIGILCMCIIGSIYQRMHVK